MYTHFFFNKSCISTKNVQLYFSRVSNHYENLNLSILNLYKMGKKGDLSEGKKSKILKELSSLKMSKILKRDHGTKNKRKSRDETASRRKKSEKICTKLKTEVS